MKKINIEKTKRKQRLLVKILILLMMVLFFLILGYRCARINLTKQQTSLYETNVNKITEIDYSKQQEALNAIVEEGKMNVNYSSKAVFNGTLSEKFNIKNISNNHYPIEFELYDEKDNCIYISKMIQPGYEMNSIELEEKLPTGVHECKLEVRYTEAGNVSSVFPITLEVK